MTFRSKSDSSLAAVLVFVLAISACLVILFQIRNGNVEDLSPAVTMQTIPALGPGVTIAPHGYKGACSFCHPTTADAPAANTQTTTLPTMNADVPATGLMGTQQVGAQTTGVSKQQTIPQGAPVFFPASQGVQFPEGQQAANISQMAAPKETVDGQFLPFDASIQQADILTPAQQNASGKMFVEGHWLGMELLDLTPALRQIYRVSIDANGVIVDEITLESAESGILAGDVIIAVAGYPTPDLPAFLKATEKVNNQTAAEVLVLRLGQQKRFTLVAKNTPVMGYAQMEAAQPIKPGALPPHKNRRKPCTTCHLIMTTGGQLPVDAGDIVPNPPAISTTQNAPHAYRGACNSCHAIKTTAVGQAALSSPQTVPLSAPPISRNSLSKHGGRGLCTNCHLVR